MSMFEAKSIFFIEDLQNVRGKVEKVFRSLKITVG